MMFCMFFALGGSRNQSIKVLCLFNPTNTLSLGPSLEELERKKKDVLENKCLKTSD